MQLEKKSQRVLVALPIIYLFIWLLFLKIERCVQK